jgi:hypothetical protein
MFGGVSKAGWATILAAGGMMLGSSISAQAADLGGDCCADLEERVAELEATTARKGNRKVSLTIGGYVDKAVMYWDDGAESNAYVVDNDNAQTRFWFTGKAKIGKGWTAGYRIEIGLDIASSDSVNQWNINASNRGSGGFSGTAGAPSFMELRQSHWFIESEKYGKVSVGLLSGAQDDLYKWGNVGKAYSDAELHYNGKFFIKQKDGANYTSLIWDNLANNLDNSRVNAVRYDTPEFAGFVASASWGEDDIWDMSIRFDQKFHTFHVKAGASYYESAAGKTGVARDEPRDFVATLGVSEKDTGLYFYGAYGHREFDEQIVGYTDSAKYYYGQVGINRKLNELGNTNFHVDYGRYDDWGAGSSVNYNVTSASLSNNSTAGTSAGRIVSSEVTRYGLGVTQNIKAAEMDVYAVYNHYEADIVTSGTQVDLDSWHAIVGGGRINF